MMQGVLVLVQQTRRFILENPEDIVFTRNTKVDDGAGGTTTTDVPLSPQTVRVVQASETSAVERQSSNGEVVRPDWRIVAMPDADIQEGDTFQRQGHNVEVVWITPLSYEIIADVAVR